MDIEGTYPQAVFDRYCTHIRGYLFNPSDLKTRLLACQRHGMILFRNATRPFMKINAPMASQGIICLVSLCLLIVTTSIQASADTITFDDVVLEDGRADISTYYYADHGIKFRGFGLYPSGGGGPDLKNRTAYGFEDNHALSGTNVIGVYWPGYSHHHLEWGYGYAVAKFKDAPTDYVAIYGVGDDFVVKVYDTLFANEGGIEDNPHDTFYSNLDGTQVGTHPVTGDPIIFLEIYSSDLSSATAIRSVAFGGIMGAETKTWFDNFIYGEPQAVPLPTSALLLGMVLIGLVGFRKKFKK